MERIRDDLYATEPEHPFPGLTTRAYLLTTPADGNVLLYNTTNEQEIEAMAGLGGVDRHYLSHQDEIASSLKLVRERHGATLHIHAAEADVAAEVSPVDDPFDTRAVHAGGLEVIPTPGHSPGSTCFLYDSPTGGRYLFTGDTLFVGDDGDWHAGHIGGHSDRDGLARALDILRDLAPDLVVSSACPTGVGAHPVDPDHWAATVATARERLLA